MPDSGFGGGKHLPETKTTELFRNEIAEKLLEVTARKYSDEKLLDGYLRYSRRYEREVISGGHVIKECYIIKEAYRLAAAGRGLIED